MLGSEGMVQEELLHHAASPEKALSLSFSVVFFRAGVCVEVEGLGAISGHTSGTSQHTRN